MINLTRIIVRVGVRSWLRLCCLQVAAFLSLLLSRLLLLLVADFSLVLLWLHVSRLVVVVGLSLGIGLSSCLIALVDLSTHCVRVVVGSGGVSGGCWVSCSGSGVSSLGVASISGSCLRITTQWLVHLRLSILIVGSRDYLNRVEGLRRILHVLLLLVDLSGVM